MNKEKNIEVKKVSVKEMDSIVKKVARWAKKNNIPLEYINPTFGPWIKIVQQRNVAEHKNKDKETKEKE